MFSPHYEKFQMYSYNCGSRKIFSRAYNRAAAPTKTECTVHVNNQVKKKKKIIKEEEVKNVEAFVFITIATLFISQEMHSLLKNTGNIKLEKHSLFPQQPSKH